jgi:hypothetical protein
MCPYERVRACCGRFDGAPTSMKVEPPWPQGCALPENKSANACDASQRNATLPFASPQGRTHWGPLMRRPRCNKAQRSERICSHSQAIGCTCLQELQAVHEREEEADREHDHEPLTSGVVEGGSCTTEQPSISPRFFFRTEQHGGRL